MTFQTMFVYDLGFFWACMEFPLLSSHDKEKRPVPLSLSGDFFRIFNYYSANWNIFEKQLD